MTNYEKALNYYSKGLWNDEQLDKLVTVKYITEDEATEIKNSK